MSMERAIYRGVKTLIEANATLAGKFGAAGATRRIFRDNAAVLSALPARPFLRIGFDEDRQARAMGGSSQVNGVLNVHLFADRDQFGPDSGDEFLSFDDVIPLLVQVLDTKTPVDPAGVFSFRHLQRLAPAEGPSPDPAIVHRIERFRVSAGRTY